MKIGLFDPYLDTMGGGEKYMLTIASSFSKKHNVSIFWDPHFESEIKHLAKDRFEFDLANVKFVQNIFAKNGLIVISIIFYLKSYFLSVIITFSLTE